MKPGTRTWRDDYLLWVEVFVIANLAFLVLDVYMAHSINAFEHWAELIPLYFSMSAPPFLIAALLARNRGKARHWTLMGHIVGWGALVTGLAGVLFHLQSVFFLERTLKSLIYAAPFAAPLAYAGLGLLLILNRMVPPPSREWAWWVLLLALGGFGGNFVLSLTDHAINGFIHPAEWLPVISSAFAVGFLVTFFFAPANRRYLLACAFVVSSQALVGVLGFAFHVAANLKGHSVHTLQHFIDGAPAFARLLLPNLMVLALISLWALNATSLGSVEEHT